MSAIYHPEGYAAPLIYIYRNNGELITNSAGVPIGHEAISFEYSYDEEEDDNCTIVIQTNDKFLPDNKYLQVKSNLVVQWGYVTQTGEKHLSPKRKIVIRDTETKYAAKSIKYKIKCTDFVALLKEVRINGIREDSILNIISEIAGGTYKATIHINNSQYIEYNNEAPDLVEDINQGTFQNVIVARENTAAPGAGVFNHTVIFKGQSKATHAAIEDLTKAVPGGPYFLDGRDDTINIRNRNFNQNTSWRFYYGEEDGNIIDFNPRTTYKKSNLEEKETNLIDGVNKLLYQDITNTVEGEDINKREGGLETASGQKLLETDIADYLNNVLVPTITSRLHNGNIEFIKDQEGVLLDKIKQDPEVLKALQLAPNLKLDEYNHFIVNDRKQAGTGLQASTTDEDGNVITLTSGIPSAVDNTAAPLNILDEVHLDISAKEILAIPGALDLLETNQNVTDNHINERKQRKVEGKLTIIGIPELQTSKIIEIYGVAKKHTGKWYTTVVSHKLSPSGGYVCELDIIKKPTPGIQVRGTKKSKFNSRLEDIQKLAAENLPVNKQILTEEEFKTIVNNYNSTSKTAIQNDEQTDHINSQLKTQSPNSPQVSGDNDVPLSNQDKINVTVKGSATSGITPNNENN